MSSLPDSRAYEVLVVEDDDSDWALIERALSRAQTVRFSPSRVTHLNNALTALRHRRYDAILLDLILSYDGPTNGIDTVVAILRECSDTPVVVLSHLSDIETAVRAVEFGAASFVEKPPDAHRLESTLRQVIERYVREEVQRRLTYASAARILDVQDAPALSHLVGGPLDAIEQALHAVRNYLQSAAPNHAAEVERILGWGHVFASFAEIRNALRLTDPNERDTLPPAAPGGPTAGPRPYARPRRAISERALAKIQEISEGRVEAFTPDDARAFLLSVQTEGQK